MSTRMRSRARQAARASGFVALTGAMLPPFLARMALTPAPQKAAVRDAWVANWARALLHLFAIQMVVDGHVPPKAPERGRLIVANHRSAIDIGVVLSLFGGTMVSRADLATWPVVGAAARAVGTVFVNRSNAESGAATLRAIQARLTAGETIHLFPEGTTFDGDEVRPFHGAAFVSAVRANAEILPIGIAYPQGSGAAFFQESFPSHLARLARSDATRMVVAVGTPFLARQGDRTRAASVTKRAHDDVSALVARARARCGC